jgi:hypothetical protein
MTAEKDFDAVVDELMMAQLRGQADDAFFNAAHAAIEHVRTDVGQPYLRPHGDPTRALSLGSKPAHEAVAAIRHYDELHGELTKLEEVEKARLQRHERAGELADKLLAIMLTHTQANPSTETQVLARDAMQRVLEETMP